MGIIVDQNERPVAAESDPGSNGQSHDKGQMHVSAIPTGTLIYNLIRYTNEEIGLTNAHKHMQMAKAQQKMIEDPPEMAKLEEYLGQVLQHRFMIAKEINERFADVDKARLDALGMEVIVPAVPKEEPPTPPAGD